MKNGRWYINDHSTNGTYVNGQRIPANTDYKISRNDSIICGTVPCPNPIPPVPVINFKNIAIAIGSIAVIALLALTLPGINKPISNVDPYQATVLVTEFYNIKVSFDNDILDS